MTLKTSVMSRAFEVKGSFWWDRRVFEIQTEGWEVVDVRREDVL